MPKSIFLFLVTILGSVPAYAQGGDCSSAFPIAGVGSFAVNTTGLTGSGFEYQRHCQYWAF